MHLPDAMVAFLAQVWSLKIIWHCDPVNCHGCGCPQFIHPRFKEVCHLYSSTLFNNSLFWCQFTKRCHAVGFLSRRLDEKALWKILKTTKRPSTKKQTWESTLQFLHMVSGPRKMVERISVFPLSVGQFVCKYVCSLQGLCHSVLSSRSVVWIIYLRWVNNAHIQGEM